MLWNLMQPGLWFGVKGWEVVQLIESPTLLYTHLQTKYLLYRCQNRHSAIFIIASVDISIWILSNTITMFFICFPTALISRFVFILTETLTGALMILIFVINHFPLPFKPSVDHISYIIIGACPIICSYPIWNPINNWPPSYK